MIDLSYRTNLPTKVNSDQLQSELDALITPPDVIACTIVYSSITMAAAEIIVHAPDDIKSIEVERVISRHAPAKDNAEVVVDRKKSDFDIQLASSPLFQATIARITELEK